MGTCPRIRAKCNAAQQCNLVLELFKIKVTEKSTLSMAEKMRLEPILLQVLWVALWGAIEVVRFYKDNYNPVRMPELLKKHDVVYLRGCEEEKCTMSSHRWLTGILSLSIAASKSFDPVEGDA